MHLLTIDFLLYILVSRLLKLKEKVFFWLNKTREEVIACGSTLHMSFMQAMGVREECHGLCKVSLRSNRLCSLIGCMTTQVGLEVV